MKQKKNATDSTERFVPAQYIREDGTIEVYSNYMVSDHGRVGSLVDTHGNKRRVMKIRNPYPCDQLGHLQVGLWINNKVHARNVHRLVLSSFHPEQYFKDAEVDHKDRNVTNNQLSNLHWVTRKENNANRIMGRLKRIRVTHLNDGHIEEFDNMHECSWAFGKSNAWCSKLIYKQNGFHKGLNIMIEKIDHRE